MIDTFRTGTFSCVMDSYDYQKALDELLPSVASEKVDKGGYMILRPDSGDQVEVVLMALRCFICIFGNQISSFKYDGYIYIYNNDNNNKHSQSIKYVYMYVLELQRKFLDVVKIKKVIKL